MHLINIEKIYESASEYGALHNEYCCVNFPEDDRACDVGTGFLDCCENMGITWEWSNQLFEHETKNDL